MNRISFFLKTSIFKLKKKIDMSLRYAISLKSLKKSNLLKNDLI